MRLETLALIVVLSLTVISCASLPGEDAARSQFVNAQKSWAAELEASGELARSLAVWHSLQPLERSGDDETGAAIKRLEKRIAKAVDGYYARGKRAYASGNTSRGDDYMLRVLVLQPGHRDALSRLAATASGRARVQQTSKSTTNYPGAVQATAKAEMSLEQRMRTLYDKGEYQRVVALESEIDSSGNSQLAGILRESHIKLADAAQRKGQSEGALEHMQAAMLAQPVADDPLISRSLSLRKGLSTFWYKEGSQLATSDLDDAIVALQKALHYNPYNNNAKRKLLQVERMKRNLHRISNSK